MNKSYLMFEQLINDYQLLKHENKYKKYRKLTKSHIYSIFSLFNFWFGLYFFCFGMLFVFIFWPEFDIITFPKDLIQVNGKIDRISKSGYSQNGKKNFRYEYHYTYFYHNKKYNGKAYDFYRDDLNDSIVPIDISKEKPFISRIKGMTTKPVQLEWNGLFLLVFPIIGLSFIFYGYLESHRNRIIYENGLLTQADVLKITEVKHRFLVNIRFLCDDKVIYCEHTVEAKFPFKHYSEIDIVYLPYNPYLVLFWRELTESEKKLFELE